MHPKILIDKLKEKTPKEKVDYLLELCNTDEFEKFCLYALDSSKSYYITSVDTFPFDPFYDSSELYTMDDVYKYLDFLNDKGSADSLDRRNLEMMCSQIHEYDKVLVDLILRRSVGCGMALGTLRKYFGKHFLPDFPCGLCSSYDKQKILKNIKFPAISQLKSDGARGECIIKSNAKLFSRNGKRYNGLESLESILSRVNNLVGDCVIDGELLVLDDDGEILDRQTGNGILNKSIKETIPLYQAARVIFVVWDIIGLDAFYSKEASESYQERWGKLNYVISALGTDRVKVIDSVIVNSLQECGGHYKSMVELGEEGTILKDLNGVWKDGRSNSQFKFKEVHEGDLLITGWYYGNKGTKYENCIGGFNVETSCKTIQTNVGSGLSDPLRGVGRSDIENYANQFIGSIMELEYNSRITKKDKDVESLFLPRCVEIRFDKDVPDSRDDLIAREIATRELNNLK